MRMTDEQREREGNYQIAITILKSLLKTGLITEGEFRKSKKTLAKRLSPVWGQYPEMCLAGA